MIPGGGESANPGHPALTCAAVLSKMPAMRSRPNQVRIIAGEWRGRKLAFPSISGLRPTSDRIRETLFNWLAPRLPGGRCLDLFAGSGALGFEAASRGAGQVTMVENDPEAFAMLERNRSALAADRVELLAEDALNYLQRTPVTFNIVFVDAPFSMGLLPAIIAALQAGGWLAEDARIYLETAQGEAPSVPVNWRLDREKRAGQVDYRLYSV